VRWELTPELIDQVIYAMENQELLFFYDIESGHVVSAEQIEQKGQPAESEEGPQRFFEVPRWRSHDGFHLMERFVAGLRNPVTREDLRDALGSGKGVFRHFKNALHAHPEIEKLWFAYKEQEMRKVVFDWFNDVRELHGLQKLSPPSEETATQELILSDFLLQEGAGNHAENILELDRASFLERYRGVDPATAADVYARRRRGLSLVEDALLLRAEAPSGELAGFAWAALEDDPFTNDSVARLVELGVAREYRGLGLGRALLEALVRQAGSEGVARVEAHLDGAAVEAAELFAESGFVVTAQTMGLHFGDGDNGT
jgi:ribosomal protein S18 acetylase RimI-like enzyme